MAVGRMGARGGFASAGSLGGENAWVPTEAALKTLYASMNGVSVPHGRSAMASPPTITAGGAGTTSAPAAPYTGLTQSFRYSLGTTVLDYLGGGEFLYSSTFRKSPSVTHGPSGGNVDTTTDAVVARDFVRANAQAAAWRVLGGDATNGYRFLMDNLDGNGLQYVSFSTTIVSGGGRQYIVLDAGSKADRIWCLERPLNLAIDGVHFAPGDAVSFPSALEKRICLVFSDSFGTGTGAPAGQEGDSFAVVLGELGGFYNIWPSGLGGTGYVANNSGAAYTLGQRIVADIQRAQLYGTVAKIHIAMGLNDINLSGIQAAASDCFDKARLSAPAASISVEGPWDANAPSAPASGYAACSSAIQAALAGRGGFRFHDMQGVAFTKNASNLPHADAAGHLTLGQAIWAKEKASFGL